MELVLLHQTNDLRFNLIVTPWWIGNSYGSSVLRILIRYVKVGNGTVLIGTPQRVHIRSLSSTNIRMLRCMDNIRRLVRSIEVISHVYMVASRGAWL